MPHQTSKPIAIVVGFIVKLPLAGMSLYCLHYIRGLMELGYDVYYVERQNYADQCYDPTTRKTTNAPTYGLGYLQRVMDWIGMPPGNQTFIDLDGVCHGGGWAELRQRIRRADFILTVADATWFDELALCPNRIFIDGDPFFTQYEMIHGNGRLAASIRAYNHLFTYAVRIGQPDCHVPETGDHWRPTRPLVATSMWTVQPTRSNDPMTTVMNWRSGSDIVHNGRRFGYKGPEFRRLIDLPQRTNRRVAIALGGSEAPRDEIRSKGWELVNPLEATKDIASYRAFIDQSWADIGIAKEAYVVSRSGWFSDRSTCYLASGRPVFHQDTGYTDWLDSSRGVLPFTDMASLLDCIERVERDHESNVRAARRVAEDYFEASKVMDEVLKEANVR